MIKYCVAPCRVLSCTSHCKSSAVSFSYFYTTLLVKNKQSIPFVGTFQQKQNEKKF